MRCGWFQVCRRPDSPTDMAHYLVTGGAGFIGSHLAEELVRRGHRVRVADSLVTGRRSNLDHLPEVEFLEGDLADLAFANHAVNGVDVVLAPGGAAIGPAIGQGSGHLESRERRRHSQRAGGGARRGRKARRLCRLLVGLRQYADAAEARGDAEQPALSVRAAESRGGAVSADVHVALRARDGDHPLLQRIWAAPGSVVCLFRSHLALCDRAAREPGADDLWRR